MTSLIFNAIAVSSSSSMISRISIRFSPSLKTKRSVAMASSIPERDIVIDFGKYKGKMLGTLPSSYLKWVSKTLRARDFEHWANLADQVLQDPVYRDRIEWEFAENVLHGNNAKVTTIGSLSPKEESAVSMLLEISERFGWDNEDKAGWSKVNFELLGTSKGGRIPRISDKDNDFGGEIKNGGTDEKSEKARAGTGAGTEEMRRREKRRERVRMKRESKEEKSRVNYQQKNLGGFSGGDGRIGVKLERSLGWFDKDRNEKQKETVEETDNPFPGRRALWNKVLNSRRRSL